MATDPQQFAVRWDIEAPWAHPFWNSYLVSLCDLTTETGEPPVKYRPDVTHEVIVWALDPETGKLLQPPNHGYQFVAPSNEAARERITALVAQIEARQLSPDTDFSKAWDVLFADGVTLRVAPNHR